MRAAIAAVVVVLVVIFIGGAVSVGNGPIFWQIDRVLGANLLMGIHRGCFFFLYRGEHTMGSGVERTGSQLKDFQERPAGIDKKGHYEKLDDASK